MCCSLDINYTATRHHGHIHIETANTFEWFKEKLKWVEISEKVAEVVDELFHLFQPALLAVASKEIYVYLNTIHHGAHEVEKLLHSFCIVTDIIQLFDQKKLGMVDLAIKVARFVSHLFAPLLLLSDLKIIDLVSATPPVRFISSLFAATHHALSTISILWNHFQDNKKIDYAALFAGSSGTIYHTLSMVQTLLPHLDICVESTKALHGVIHALCAIYLLRSNSHIQLQKV